MNITGNIRPFANTQYSYTLTNIKGKVSAKLWKIEYNGKILSTNAIGSFKFHQNLAGKTVKIIATTIQNKKEIAYSTSLTILAGKPKVISLQWQDSKGKPIGNRTVKYLDKVKLAVKTSNIPVGDSLKVSVFEDDTTGDRPMGTYDTSAVNENGFAYLYFNQLSLYQTKLNDKDWIDESEHEYYVKIEYRNHISQTEEKIQLTVHNDLSKAIDEPQKTNMPVVVGKVSTVAKPKKKPVHFTFGVFLDGTLNNMYNTELRKLVEENTTTINSGLVVDRKTAQIIYDKKGDADDMESSYENDLSNPAILFKNYKRDKPNKLFRIYTEGVGTNTAPKSQGGNLSQEDYKKDDVMQGPAFGIGTAGIKDNVRKAIRDCKIEISKNISANETVGTITFDVFGFSRGAAAARNFVHVVTQGSYPAITKSWKEGYFVKDKFGYELDASYANQMMPNFGFLGQLLTSAKLMDEQMKVVIRFVGIYDTVPHHGLFQWNDIKDLGLDDVNRADYVVHMTAGDEHRANFSLVDISSVAKTSPDSGKKGGIELEFPGVHCDVGGAYEEGRPDNPKRIDATYFSSNLEPLRLELIRQGWFKEEEIFIKFDMLGTGTITKRFNRLEGKRAHLSNQYSYIPLHIMAEFCKKKTIPVNKDELIKSFNFKENPWINKVNGNVKFLTDVKAYLKKYSFEGGKPISFNEPLIYKEPPIVYETNNPNASIYIAERNQRQIDGQNRMNAEADKKNETIKFLRNHYLHWNSTYGESGMDIAVQKNYPNKVQGKRKRHTR